MYLCHCKNKTYMNKVLYAIVSLLALTSCGNGFRIVGNTSVSMLDGKKLYLKMLKDTAFKSIDSCDVVHGQFEFTGSTDSVRVANIILDDNSSIPVVLENGDIQVKIDNTQESVTGTPLNEKLTTFRQKFTQLLNQSADLVHQHDQAIMNGSNMNAVNARLAQKDAEINQQMDKLVTSFITDNFDNILAPYVFINVCMNRYQVPMLDAWVEDIMSKATDKFKGNPQVKEYYEAALQNQNIMNGTSNPMDNMQAEPLPTQQATQMPEAPTPNELANPSGEPKDTNKTKNENNH